MKKLACCLLLALVMVVVGSWAAQKAGAKTGIRTKVKSSIRNTILTKENQEKISDMVVKDKAIAKDEASAYLWFISKSILRSIASGDAPAYVGMTVGQVIQAGKELYAAEMKAYQEKAKKPKVPGKDIVLTDENDTEIFGEISYYSDVTKEEAELFRSFMWRAQSESIVKGVPAAYIGMTVGQIIEEEGKLGKE